MKQIKIGTCVPGPVAEEWLKGFVGKGFETFVKDGDRVKRGDKLIGFDIKYIQEHAKSDECMVVFTSLQEGEEIRMSKSGKVEKLEKTAEIVSLN